MSEAIVLNKLRKELLALWRYRGLNPLPGGRRNYLSFLTKVLTRVQSANPLRSELSDWIRNEFRVTGRESPKTYIHILFTLGLIEDKKNGLSLSKNGESFLLTRKQEIVFNALVENYMGVSEITDFLKRRQAASVDEIRKMLLDTCDLKWDSRTQIERRLSWLIALGYVIRAGGKYSLSRESSIGTNHRKSS